MSIGRLNAIRWNQYPHAEKMSSVEQSILLHLADCENEESGQCDPSIAEIRRATHLSESAINTSLAYLRDFPDIITWRHKKSPRGLKKNFYEFHFDKVSRREDCRLGYSGPIRSFRRTKANTPSHGVIQYSAPRSNTTPPQGVTYSAPRSNTTPSHGVSILRHTEINHKETKNKPESNPKAIWSASQITTEKKGPSWETVYDWGKRKIDHDFLKDLYDRLSEAEWKTPTGQPISRWPAYMMAIAKKEGGGIKEAHNRMLDNLSENDYWRDTRREVATKWYAKKHGLELRVSDNPDASVRFFIKDSQDPLQDMQKALQEYDAAIDQGEIDDITYRGRYYDLDTPVSACATSEFLGC